MSTIFPLDRAFRVTPNDSGNIAEFGPAAPGSFTGSWMFDFVPDASFQGALTLMMRIAGPEAKKDGVGLVPAPYRALFLNGASPAVPMSFATDPLTGRSIVQVPSAQLSVAVLISCTQGFGWLYSRDASGSSAP